MAFVKIEKSHHFTKPEQIPVSMGIYNADGKKFKGRTIIFRIAVGLCHQLWPTSEDEVLYLGVYEGTGTDAGFLQLRQDPRGYKIRPITKGRVAVAYMIAVVAIKFMHYTLNDTQTLMTPVQYIAEGDTLVIE